MIIIVLPYLEGKYYLEILKSSRQPTRSDGFCLKSISLFIIKSRLSFCLHNSLRSVYNGLIVNNTVLLVFLPKNNIILYAF